MDAAISGRAHHGASTEDSYLRLRRVIKAIPADFQGIPIKDLRLLAPSAASGKRTYTTMLEL
jgi:hypothetical protein